MVTINGGEVRVPRRVRQAVADHHEVVVLNRERPVFVIVNPEDLRPAGAPGTRGRRLGEALALLGAASQADEEFADDMEAVLQAGGPAAADPWAHS